MKIIRIKEGTEYRAIIDSYRVTNDNKLQVFVLLDENDTSSKSLFSTKINPNEESIFSNFCETMRLVDENDDINLRLLEEVDCPVWVQFKEMSDGKKFISSMHWDEKILEEKGYV
jgi:hypothetical protein